MDSSLLAMGDCEEYVRTFTNIWIAYNLGTYAPVSASADCLTGRQEIFTTEESLTFMHP